MLKLAAPEERIYAIVRRRLVDVIPWVGFTRAFSASRSAFVAVTFAFQTLLDPKQLPNQNTGVLA